MTQTQKIPTRIIIIQGETQVDTLQRLIPNLPRDGTVQVTIGPVKTQRKQSKNDAMWAGILRDMAEQAFIRGRRYDDKTWHELFKAEYLPENHDPELHLKVVNPEAYQKWVETPTGKRILKGSTKDLTDYGMNIYMHQIEAFGASLGVQFSAPPSQGR